ncbi:MAG TPA: hypothetical protein VEW25_03460 [Allosphingosinicella sp.]|nr:hypothetical protein [Allosphingosinicella sp.]
MNLATGGRAAAIVLMSTTLALGGHAWAQTDAQLRQRIIRESIASYPGSCPCPYNTDRAGRRCGARSAYSRPGGYAPICYPADVTPAMVRAARGR